MLVAPTRGTSVHAWYTSGACSNSNQGNTMGKSLEEMTARELCAGLMRGDRVDMKLGYSYEAAALTAAEHKDLTEPAVKRLLNYALGFGEGMAHALHRADSDTAEGPPVRSGFADDRDYVAGRRDGEAEEGFLLYPDLSSILNRSR